MENIYQIRMHSRGGQGAKTAAQVIAEAVIEEGEFSQAFSEYGPVPFTIRFENTGTIHVRPRGFVTITNWQGKKVVDIPFPQQNVIPGAIRKIETSWDKKWLAGRYTATIIGSYGTANIPITPWVINFWVFPWKLALGIFLAVLAITIYFVKTRKRWRMALRILIKGENA